MVSDIIGPHSYLHLIVCSQGKPVRGVRQGNDTIYQRGVSQTWPRGMGVEVVQGQMESMQKSCYCLGGNVGGLTVGMRGD